MDATLIDDGAQYRQIDGLVTEFSSEVWATNGDEFDELVKTTLSRIGEAIGADSTTLAVYGERNGVKTYRWADSTVELEDDLPAVASLWDKLPLNNEPLIFARIPGDLPSDVLTPDVLELLRHVPLGSAVIVPVTVGGERACVLWCEAQSQRVWSTAVVGRLRLFTQIVAGGLRQRQQEFAIRDLRNELTRMTEDEHAPTNVVRLQDHAHDREQDPEHYPTPRHSDMRELPEVAVAHEIVGDSASLLAALRRVQEVAPTRSTVLLQGETGTGKELFARAIHQRSLRRSRALVIVNCAALPPSLIESELFGHTRGAFTGAVSTRQGRFELAHRGTIFLDEIGDLPLDLQTKLLRVLQEGSFERLGSSQTQAVDVRIVAATHRDLRKMISEGAFREDLYYRLTVFPIRLPPLRERREDIPKLVWAIIRKRQHLSHQRIRQVPQGVMDQLQRRNWPGNVRELENVIERALIHTTGDVLTLLDEKMDADEPPAEDGTTLSSVERTHIQEVLRECGWRINGAGNAAERLGLHPNTLRFRMKKLGIVREGSRASVGIASA